MRSLYNLLSVDPGFKTAEVLSANLPLNWSKYSNLKDQNIFFQQILERAQRMPGVQDAALSSIVPLNNTEGMNRRVSPSKAVRSFPVSPCHRSTISFRHQTTSECSASPHSPAAPLRMPTPLIQRASLSSMRRWRNIIGLRLDPIGKRISTDEGKT